MNEYSKSGIIDFKSRKEAIERKRSNTKNNTESVTCYEKKVEYNNKQNKKTKNDYVREKSFREMIFEGQKTSKEYAYDKAWKEFEKVLNENRLMDRNRLRRCRYESGRYYSGRRIDRGRSGNRIRWDYDQYER